MKTSSLLNVLSVVPVRFKSVSDASELWITCSPSEMSEFHKKYGNPYVAMIDPGYSPDRPYVTVYIEKGGLK